MMKRDKPEAKRTSPAKKMALPHEQDVHAGADEVQKSLEQIYRAEGGEMPDFGRFDRVQRSWWLRAVVAIGVVVILLSLLAWTGLFALQPLKQPNALGLILTLHEPKDVTLGKEEEIIINWENASLQPLAMADIRLSLPPEFRLLSAEPAPTDARLLRWDLGLLAPRAQGKILLKGLFLGTLGEGGTVQVLGNFRNQNTDRDRQVVVTDVTNYKSTVLEGSLTLPDTALPGDVVVMQYSLKNQSTKSLENLIARIAVPEGFLPMTSTTIDAETRSLEFRIGTLPSQSVTTIQLPGKFTPGIGGDATFVVQAGQKQGEQFFPIQQGEKRISVLAGELTFRVVANGISGSELRVAPGEPIRVLLEYQNTSPEILQNIILTWSIESLIDGKIVAPGALVDLAQSATDPVTASSTKARLATFQYDKSTIPALASLVPGASGRIELLFPTIIPLKSLKLASIRLGLQSEIGSIGKTVVKRKVALAPLMVQYKTDADLSVETRYYTEEGAPLGSGPLPPLAGNTTSYRVFWSLRKKLHALEDVEVVARLPRIAAWSQKTQVDTGTLTYDEKTREVRWRLKKVPEDVQELTASFEVQLTPELIDIGRFATVLEETSFRAHDTIVDEWITRRKPMQTTDLQQDEAAKAKGVVRKQ
jgi:hypothetical protein